MEINRVLFITKTLFFLLLEIFPSIAGENDPIFRNDYIYIKEINSHVKEHTTKQKWVNAVAICKAEGAKMFVPKSMSDTASVAKVIKTIKASDFIWVGIHDMFSEGQFTTIDGKRMSEVYNVWGTNEPNDAAGDQNCLIFMQNGLYDINCDSLYAYICIKEDGKNSSRNLACDTHDFGYVYNSEADRCYKLHTDPMNWKDAFRTCQAEQSHLAIINCVDEAGILINILNVHPPELLQGKFYKNIIHLGFNDLLYDRQFMTISGETLKEAGYDIWGHKQPDNYQSEHCGSMYRDGTLNDINCDNILSMFVCEKPLSDANIVNAYSRFGI